jgi:hypothetical protein
VICEGVFKFDGLGLPKARLTGRYAKPRTSSLTPSPIYVTLPKLKLPISQVPTIVGKALQLVIDTRVEILYVFADSLKNIARFTGLVIYSDNDTRCIDFDIQYTQFSLRS